MALAQSTAAVRRTATFARAACASKAAKSSRFTASGRPWSDRLRLHRFEVVVEHPRQARAILAPMRTRGRLLQSLNPVAVELVHCSVDAVALQPAVAERAAVAERRARRAFGEPRVPSQERFESLHSSEVLLELRDRRSAEMQQAIAIIVQFERQLRLSPRRDFAIEPPLECRVLRCELRISRRVPIAIEIHAAQVEPGSASRDAILVRHRQHADVVDAQEAPHLLVISEEAFDEPLRNPIAARFPRMRPRADEHSIWGSRIADANDLELPARNRLADRFNSNERVGPDCSEQPIEIRQSI